ncbi:MAG: hypothetical protein QOK43_2831 [Acidimicrobiaceae bacterium]|nr:hypothetical protein [Acidimicrobiaceae bacterium]
MTQRRAAVAVAFAFASAGLLLGAACTRGRGSDTASSTTSPPPSTSTTATVPTTTTAAPPVRGVKLTEVAAVTQPTAMAVRADDPALYVAEKTGFVRRLVGFKPEPRPVIDVSANLTLGSEQGLLGLAFSPDGRFLYIDYTDRNGDTHIDEHDMTAPATPLRRLLFVDQPYANHNGGQLAFGPDGLLYIALGDGGSGNDPHNNAQNLGVLLGKILRIDPRPDGNLPYRIPADNPFAGQAGKRGEIWAYGLRNPWRFSFDRTTNDMWIADVGQGAEEEIDLDPAPPDGGHNYEWPLQEGTQRLKGDRPAGGVPPVYEYSHDGGNCSVTGGYAYRGKALRGFEGMYFFADYCGGKLMGLRNGKAEDLHVDIASPASFGQDADGEVYALSLKGSIYRLDPK